MTIRAEPSFHLSEEFLLDYATGAASEPLSLLVATHLTLCPRCRREVLRLETLGGLLLDELEPMPLAGTALDTALSRMDCRPNAPVARGRRAAPVTSGAAGKLGWNLPRPLSDYVASTERPAWRRRGAGLETIDLLPEQGGTRTRLMRIKASRAMPFHAHAGTELTLVLAGGFSDAEAHYQRGDVAVADGSIEHRPVADAGEDCLCLAVTDGRIRLKGWFGRFLNPFLSF